MSLNYVLHPSGIYVTEYQRDPGEMEGMIRRSEQRQRCADIAPPHTLAGLIRQRKSDLGLGYREIADQVGVAHNLVRKWGIGESRPNERDMRTLIEALQMDRETAMALWARKDVVTRWNADAGMESGR